MHTPTTGLPAAGVDAPGIHLPQDTRIPAMPALRTAVVHPTPPIRYAVTVLDAHGRIASASLLRTLAWQPGDSITFTIDQHRLITAERRIHTDAATPFAIESSITARHHLVMPINVRRRADLTTGDQLLLTADEQGGQLRIWPPATLAAALQHYTSGHQHPTS